MTLAAVGDAALGLNVSSHWNQDFDNAANKAFDLRLMPNPTDDELLVQLAQTPADDAFLDLFDPSGRILMRVPFRGVRHLRLATAALADGTYLRHVVNGAEILDRRFVKMAR